MEERGIGAAPPKRPPAIAFLDLAGYTALAEERGDEAAAEVASDLAGVVQDTSRAHGGRPVKWLGDGVMFHFDDPAGAIRGGLELLEQTERAISVPARIAAQRRLEGSPPPSGNATGNQSDSRSAFAAACRRELTSASSRAARSMRSCWVSARSRTVAS
jgi:class 3 adenylate cyclase